MARAEEKIEDILNINKRWLPPAPHAEKVLEAVRKGMACIEERGHNRPPLLVFEDGGVIELPLARYKNTYRGMQLVSSSDSLSVNQTRNRDVCGSIDELKGLLKDKPELAKSEPERLYQLLNDARYMILRMQKRREEYEKFISEVVSTSKQVEGPETEQAYGAIEEIRVFLKNYSGDKLERLYELAEQVRQVAGKQEGCLSEYKDLAIKIGKLSRDIKGGRNWEEEKKD